MTRMRFSFRSAPDQLCTAIRGSNRRVPDLNAFKIRWLANQAEHAAAGRPVLDTETALGSRLRGVLRALIDVQAPYHAFAAKLYKHAAEPASPLSPFSKESSPPGTPRSSCTPR
jgi:hypothetical protein